MNRKLASITLIALLCLSLGTGGAAGQGLGVEEDVHAQGDVSITAAVNSRISYQGILEEGGTPVTGNRDMIFRLYSDSSCVTQVGSDIPKVGVKVTEGLFSVELPVAHNDFNGQGLWLRVDVAGTPIGCQEILPSPYALSLKPGASIVGAVPGSWLYDGTVLKVHNTSGYNTYGIKSITDSTTGAGVWGLGPTNGVRGYATADSGGSVGVNGGSVSPDGKGVYGSSTYFDSYGYLGGGFTEDLGEFGIAETAVGAYGYNEDGFGVYGESATGDGVYGESGSGNAVRGVSSSGHGIYGSSSSGIGVYGFSSSGYAGHFVGTVRTDILEIAGGSDLAEPFEVAGAESILPGMVVAIDPQHPGQLRVAEAAYDRTVAGCVSGANGINPGLTMAQEGTVADGALPVALSGRVYCWADATYSPIEPGDLLTTSDTPGCAMVANDPAKSFGTVLGKALSSLESGQGLVLVLVSLQ